MKYLLTFMLIITTLSSGSSTKLPGLDSLYFYYAENDLNRAFNLLQKLANQKLNREQQLLISLEWGDYYLDKLNDYHRAESVYQQIINSYPRHRILPDVLYRLAIAQELQEKYLDAAKNYEQVATRYIKSTYAQDALDAIERCFRKNYQERVAYVNNHPITRIELDDRISRNPANYESFESKLRLLDTMIDNRLLYEAAMNDRLLKDPEIVKNLSDIRNRQMFQVWYEYHVTSKAEPTEKEIRAAYNKNRAKYTIPEKVQGYQLVVTNRKLADSLRTVLLADTGRWNDIVKTFSIAPDKERGGDMGLFARGVHPKPIETVAFTLKPGEISLPIAIGDTYYLIRVTRREPKRIKPLSEVRNQIAIELRQERINKIYEQKIASLKNAAAVIQDSLAIDQQKETLATVNGIPITYRQLEERLNAIPPFFRGQFDTPEGKRRLLDQLIIERLLLNECEKEKFWLRNRVLDHIISRRTALLIDAYRRRETTNRVQLDSAVLYAEYQKNIDEFKEPTRVRCREMVTRTRFRAEQLRSWAIAGKVPPLIDGIAFLLPDENRLLKFNQVIGETKTPESLVALGALADPRLRIKNSPTQQIAGKEVPDLSRSCKIAGPFSTSELYAFAFDDLSSDDTLYQPEIIDITSPEELSRLYFEQGLTESITNTVDSTRLGTYVKLLTPLPSKFTKDLFRLNVGDVSPAHKTPGGYLLVKITRKDTAQKIEFPDLIRRFSTAGSKWAGGEIFLTKDDRSRDPKIVNAAYSLKKGAFSPVIKLNDTTFTFIKMEEKKEAYVRPFKEVRGKIESKLRREKEKQLYEDLIARLRQKAKIEILMKEEDFRIEPTEQPQEQQR